jgi:hypothetical protein
MNRPVLCALCLLIAPSLAHAQGGDRYGPSAAPDAAPAAALDAPIAKAGKPSPPPYRGAYLAWANKPQGERTDLAIAPAAAPTAEPIPTPASAPYAPPIASLYDNSRPATVGAPSRQPAPPSAARPAVAPTPTPAAPVAVAAAATQPAAPTVRARFYSLHRAYGDRPDAIAVPTERSTVLIGPSDNRNAASDEDESSTKTSPDAPF